MCITYWKNINFLGAGGRWGKIKNHVNDEIFFMEVGPLIFQNIIYNHLASISDK